MTVEQMQRRIVSRLIEEHVEFGDVLGLMYVEFSYGPDRFVASWIKGKFSVCRVLVTGNGHDTASTDWWSNDIEGKLNSKIQA